MPLAIFGITSNVLNLVVTFALLGLVAIWIALIVFTFNDARRRISDPFLVACATAASFFPFIGTVIYTILRPPEFLEDVTERETELAAPGTQQRHLKARACGRCGFPVEHDFMRCPSCRTRLKEACPTCERPVGLEWKLCPYCETTLIAPKRSSRSGSGGSSKSPKPQAEKKARPSRASRSAAKAEAKSSSSRAETKAASARSESKPATDRGDRARSSSRSSSPEPRDSSSRESGRESSSSSRPADDSGQRRSSRSSRRSVVVPDEEAPTTAHKPINSGSDSTSRRTPEDR